MFWSGGGGGSRFAVNLARRLALRYGAERVSLSLRADDPTLAFARRLDVNVRAADVVSARARPLETALSFMRSRSVLDAHIRAAGATHVLFAMNFATAAPLAVTLKTPFAYFAHDPDPHPGDYQAQMQRWTQSLLLARAAQVVAMSRYAADQLAPRLKRAPVVTPLGAVFEPRAAARPALAADAPMRLLLVGRLIAYKGLRLLAEALKPLAARDDWRLTIAGHGPAADEARALFGALPQVLDVRTQWLSDADVDALIAAHDVLLAPYESATQSGVVCEALADAMPVAATPAGALGEQIMGGAAGWLADACTPEAFARTLAAALDQRAGYAAKSHAALATAQRTWTEDYWAWLDTF